MTNLTLEKRIELIAITTEMIKRAEYEHKVVSEQATKELIITSDNSIYNESKYYMNNYKYSYSYYYGNNDKNDGAIVSYYAKMIERSKDRIQILKDLLMELQDFQSVNNTDEYYNENLAPFFKYFKIDVKSIDKYDLQRAKEKLIPF